MIVMKQLRRIDDTKVEVPVGYVPNMLSSGIIYVDESLQSLLEDKAIKQVANIATLPGLVGFSIAMPDIHAGYGFPIGGVAGFDVDAGVISPGGVGYDINCGVRLLKTHLTLPEVKDKIDDLTRALYEEIPSGVGSKGGIKLTAQDAKKICMQGAMWAVSRQYGSHDDLQFIESGGALEGADPDCVSPKAFERGKSQLGTLGSGNHFVEIQYVSDIYDEVSADAFGLFRGQITVMIHSGSRGFGHQICEEYLHKMLKAASKYGITLPDRELASAPFKSQEAQEYFSAMKCAANYAWANRQCITQFCRDVFMKQLKISAKALSMTVLYDVAHNIAKLERHVVDGKLKTVIVHRKGSTRAFPAGHPEIPEAYKDIGQPVITPGDMGRASYVLVGLSSSMQETFGSTCHGAGRVLSRNQAISSAKGRNVASELKDNGITVLSASKATLAEEMPEAYKDIESVVSVVTKAKIAKKVARLKPLGVIKG